jgi:IS5 family transposase
MAAASRQAAGRWREESERGFQGRDKGEKRKNDTHTSTADPKGAALQEERRRQIPALLHGAYMKYALMENRNGLVVDAEVTQASGVAEREAALRMVKRSVRRGSTLGADKAYDAKDFVQSLREQEVTPHVAAKRVGSAINGRTTRHAGYAVSLKKRKRVEEIFGWSKTVGGLRKTRFIGLAKVSSQTIFTFACDNLTRMAMLLGWRLSSA